MSASVLLLGIDHLPERNARASQVIGSYAGLQASASDLHSLGGFGSIPGANPNSVAAALAGGIPRYQELARSLSIIYQAPLEEIQLPNAAPEAGADVAEQFGMDFLEEIGSEIITEMDAQGVAWQIPVVGGVQGVALHLALAATITWRVGTMVAIFYQHGGRWVGSRKETYRRAKDMTGGLSPGTADCVDLNELPGRIPEVKAYQIAQVMNFVWSLLEVGPATSDSKLRQILRGQGINEEVIDAAFAKIVATAAKLRHSRKKGIAAKGPPLPSSEGFAQQLFAGLPGDQEQRLIGLAGRLDEYREAIRTMLVTAIYDYVHDRNPAKRPERQRSVDIINGLMKRLGFALEHPDHPGQKCYLYLAVDSGNPQGNIRLLAEGATSKPLDLSARLSHFAYLRVIDATTPIEPAVAEPAAFPSSWPDRIAKAKAGSKARPRS